MRVAWFPKTQDLQGNPYWERLEQELITLGVEFETSHNSYWTQRRWLLNHRKAVSVLHFHFIQPHYVAAGERASVRRLIKFTADLLLARLLGYRIVWTVHDLMPTWPLAPLWIERAARVAIAQLSNHVIVHCEEARRLLGQHFKRSHSVWTIPHAGFEASLISREEARKQLGLAACATVISFTGGIRPNKGIEELVNAFSQISDANAVLVIAGRPWKPESYVREIRAMADLDKRIHLMIAPTSHQELQVFARAASVTVLPFKNILTSSSAVLAMSSGSPIVVPRLGCLAELVGNEAGVVYDPEEIGGLFHAIQQALSSNLERMGKAAADRASRVTWADMAQATARVYRMP